MLTLFTPNAPHGRTVPLWLIASQMLGCALLWAFSPFPFLPRPAEVATALHDLWLYDNLGSELATSFSLNLQALVLSTLLSLFLAYLATLGFFQPPIALFGELRFLSMAGLSFAFTLLTTNGHQLKLSMLVFGISVFFVVGMADVVANIPQEQFDLARTLHMGPWQSLWEVVVLGQLDQAWIVLRQNAAMGWLLISLVESMSRSGGGIGALLATQNRYFNMAAVMAVQLCVLTLGLAQDAALGWLRGACCPWVPAERRA